MLFNSLPFLLFLPLVFGLYWFVLEKNLKVQNSFIILASYVFYGWWDWRFLGLILLSSAVDYLVGNKIYQSQNPRYSRIWLSISLVINLGVLGFFKYFNFFVESFAELFGLNPGSFTLHIILPVGISFYTFQTLSYTIDIYKRKIIPTKDPIAFFAFVAFFPQLVAGPIERATNLLPQFLKPRKFEYAQATDGLRQMLWGFFKKLVIADNCAPIVDEIFANYTEMSAGSLWLGLLLFSFQIYGDFSGYSDIAIGTARLFGINLSQNFANPYFSRDIAEFWRRWHISLTTWFRDYLYIPLGGSRVGKWKVIRNIFIVFLISGLWHGANWTFIVWGGVHATLFLPLVIFKKNRRYLEPITLKSGSAITTFFRVIVTFLIVTLIWVFFRSAAISDALAYFSGMFTFEDILEIPYSLGRIIFSLIILLIFEWIFRKEKHGLSIDSFSPFFRWTIYFGLGLLILLLGNYNNITFIYFAF